VRCTFGGLGRFAEPWLLVLTSLADGPKHGYAIMADVAAFSGVRMEPGTLYGALARLDMDPAPLNISPANASAIAPRHEPSARSMHPGRLQRAACDVGDEVHDSFCCLPLWIKVRVVDAKAPSAGATGLQRR
jgi:Transcriptional regulator PadR-like family